MGEAVVLPLPKENEEEGTSQKRGEKLNPPGTRVCYKKTPPEKVVGSPAARFSRGKNRAPHTLFCCRRRLQKKEALDAPSPSRRGTHRGRPNLPDADSIAGPLGARTCISRCNREYPTLISSAGAHRRAVRSRWAPFVAPPWPRAENLQRIAGDYLVQWHALASRQFPSACSAIRFPSPSLK